MMSFDADLYRRLLETSPEGVVLVDAPHPDHPVVYVNPAFRGPDRLCRSRSAGTNLRLLQADDREQDGRHRLREALKPGESCRVLLRNYRKDGTLFWNEMTVVPLRDRRRPGDALRGPSSRCRRPVAHRSEAVARFAERRASADRRRRSRRPADRAVHAALPAGVAEARLGHCAARAAQHRGVRHRYRCARSVQRDLRPGGRRLGHPPRGALRFRLPAPLERCHRAHRRRQPDGVCARADDGAGAALGELMAESVRELRIHHPRSAVLRYVSVSVGVCAAVPGADDSPATLLDKSQQQLKPAKKSGRNRAA